MEQCTEYLRKQRNNMENMDKIEKNTQKILEKLISEETLAVEFYKSCVHAIKYEQSCSISEKFLEIAQDEDTDHLDKLLKFAKQNDFNIPFKRKDIEKKASKKMVSLLDKLKAKEDASYYIEQAIISEMDAIKSYQDAMSQEYMFDLQPILLNNYYDEIKHLEDLQLLLQCVNVGVTLI